MLPLGAGGLGDVAAALGVAVATARGRVAVAARVAVAEMVGVGVIVGVRVSVGVAEGFGVSVGGSGTVGMTGVAVGVGAPPHAAALMTKPRASNLMIRYIVFMLVNSYRLSRPSWVIAVGEAFDVPARRIHDVDVGRKVAVGRKGDPVSIRRPGR